MNKFFSYCRTHHFLIALLIAVLIGFGAVLYSTTLIRGVDGDEIVSLEANKARADISYPDRTMVMAMGYDTYAYPMLLSWLNEKFDIVTYKTFLLFLIVSSIFFAAYLAFYWLGFSPPISLSTSLVALMPRFGPVGEVFGALTPMEVTGRCLALPFFWLITAWYIRRYKIGKSVFPVFFVLGLVSYIHPATMVLFFGLLLPIHFVLILSEKKYLQAIKDTIYNGLAFCLSAIFLLTEILTRSASIAAPVIGKTVQTADYVSALFYRIPWEYPPENLIWFRHVLIVSALFIGCVWYVFYLLRKGKIQKGSMEYTIISWSSWAMLFSFVIAVAVPSLQLFAIQKFNAPLVLWQFGRIFKFFYLGILLIFPIALTHIYKDYGRKWAIMLVVVGVLSSSFFLKWGEFFIHYRGYQREYIPVAFQKIRETDQFVGYDSLCAALYKAGAKKNDIVLDNDFNLRYFCGVRPHSTFEEGSAHIFLGKASLIDWYRDIQIQEQILKGDSARAVISYAKKTGASFALIPKDSPAVNEFVKMKSPITYDQGLAIVRLTSVK